ncbi:hypothetical protein DKX38_023319 [Salix brachista]|uniref:Uncharacterized protein n=1 Tax=Salix brachista TaxID=2182728 RepID=A0A5N5JND3_9ROSI|nr:hypothetical protein DKX38_023319 [Salix brachista]
MKLNLRVSSVHVEVAVAVIQFFGDTYGSLCAGIASDVAASAVGASNVFGTTIASSLMDRQGRKSLLITSFFGMFHCRKGVADHSSSIVANEWLNILCVCHLLLPCYRRKFFFFFGRIMDDVSTTSHALTIPPMAMMAPEPTSIPYGVKLNGPNFSLWSQVVTMFVAGRGRMGYLNGTTPQPAVTSATYSKWIMEDAIVKGWLIGAMEANVMTLFIRLPTAKNVWDAMSKTYYEGADKSILYDLSRKAMTTKQAGRSVAAYYSDLQIIWQELDHRRPIPFTQADVINTRMTEIGEDRVYLFLAGLDDVYDSIRGDILRTDPLPGPDVAFSTVRREELRRHTMMNQSDTSQMAMAVKKVGNHPITSSSLMPVGGPCTHCGSTKHVAETCFKKHGYPDWWPAHKERLQARKSGKMAMCTSMPLPASVTPSSATQPSCAPVAALPTTSVDCLTLWENTMEALNWTELFPDYIPTGPIQDTTVGEHEEGTAEATTEVVNQVQPSVSVDLDIFESPSLTSSTVPTPNSPRAVIPEASISCHQRVIEEYHLIDSHPKL